VPRKWRLQQPPTFTQSLAPLLRFRKNSFGFLRLFFASVVVFSHSFPIGGFGKETLEWLSGNQVTLGVLAVYGFFLVSGYLITQSALSTTSVVHFLWNRALRILPGYWFCLVVTAFVLAPFMYWLQSHSSNPLEALWAGRPNPFDYIFWNSALVLVVGNISNVLEEARVPRAINGSLWTLQYEALCYLAVGGLSFLGVFRRWPRAIVGLTVVVWLWCVIDVTVSDVENFVFRGSWSLRLGVHFAVGACVALYENKIPNSYALLGISVVALVVSCTNDTFIFVSPFAFGYVVFFAAANLGLPQVGLKRDLSYGIYLYAFPLQQLLSLTGVERFGLFPFAVASLALSAAFALLSYSVVEAPALKWKRK
jgi:peptidoglycan/LPS O-acetylase OafA/YrhL